MFENLTFALSCLSPNQAERAELAGLYPEVDERWQQKMDRARALVTVRDAGVLVAAGLVHDSIIAPTSAMDALELGSMAVRPDYRRLGIRQKVTQMRLDFALQAGGTPITIINSANPASWAFYERSELWERERSFEQDGQTKYIYRATDLARLQPVDPAPAGAQQLTLSVPASAAPMVAQSLETALEQALEAQTLEVPAEHGLGTAVPALHIGPDTDDTDPVLPMFGSEASDADWFGSSTVDPAF